MCQYFNFFKLSYKKKLEKLEKNVTKRPIFDFRTIQNNKNSIRYTFVIICTKNIKIFKLLDHDTLVMGAPKTHNIIAYVLVLIIIDNVVILRCNKHSIH